MVIRVVPVLLMSRGPLGGNDAARPVTAQSRDDKQHITGRHTDNPYPFFSVPKAGIDLLEPIGVFNRCDGIHKIDAVSATISAAFAASHS
jgi:hypothetical protein